MVEGIGVAIVAIRTALNNFLQREIAQDAAMSTRDEAQGTPSAQPTIRV